MTVPKVSHPPLLIAVQSLNLAVTNKSAVLALDSSTEVLMARLNREGMLIKYRSQTEFAGRTRLFPSVRLALCLGVGFLLVSPFNSVAQQEPPTADSHWAAPDTFDEAAEARVFELLAAERQKAGVPALEKNQDLSDQARLHALQVAKYGEISSEFPGEVELIHRLQLSNKGIAAAA